MQKTWVSSVVAGLLILAPIAAVAQTGGGETDEVETVEETLAEETLAEEGVSEETETLELVDETETDDVPGDDGDDPAGEANDHGQRVSAVAQCAPTGKLDIDGFRNHGAFVRAVAKGEAITVEGTEFDLSSQEGVDALCAWAATYEPADPAGEEVEATSVEDGTEDRGKPDHAGPPAHAGKPADAGKAGKGNGKKGR